MTNNTMEVYVHVPFCVRKCDYCDFCSYAGAESKIRPYFSRLKEEIRVKAHKFNGGFPVDSIFFGGGTPTFPDAELICETLDTIKQEFNVLPNAEITTEANPNSVTFDKLKMYKDAGFNRLSLGLQSTNTAELKALGRSHSFEDFLRAYENARKTGLHNINVDIMTGIPGQTLESLSQTFNSVIKLDPEHISAYSLIIEEGTPFYDRYRDGSGLPTEEADREMYRETDRILSGAGYHRYEISNYAKPGFECRHNIGYWIRKPYLGFGIAAASFYNETRYAKHRDLDRFIAGDLEEEAEKIDRNGQIEEFMFLGLRMTRGISLTDFKDRFGSDLDTEFPGTLEKLNKEGLICTQDGKVLLTADGLDLENYVTGHFIK